MLSMLTRPQRVGYILSSVLMGSGWLFLLALTLEWSSAHWSRPVLALQGAALMLALLLVPHVPAQRLIVYRLTLTVSIYLLDTTLPPPNFPSGWPREIIPRLVLVGLLVDSLQAMHWRRRQQRRATHVELHPVALDDAARVLGLAVPELRIRLQRRRFGITIDTTGREYLSVDQLRMLRWGKKPPWWQLDGWLLLMSAGVLFVMPLVIPASYAMAARGAWCVLTLGGMGVWMWKHQDALRDADRAKQRGHKRGERTIPLSPVQERFLAVMECEKDRSQ